MVKFQFLLASTLIVSAAARGYGTKGRVGGSSGSSSINSGAGNFQFGNSNNAVATSGVSGAGSVWASNTGAGNAKGSFKLSASGGGSQVGSDSSSFNSGSSSSSFGGSGSSSSGFSGSSNYNEGGSSSGSSVGSSGGSSGSSGFSMNDGQFKETSGLKDKIQAAVQTKHSIEFKNVDIPIEDLEPQIIEVEGGAIPLEIHFKSSSSRIKVHQTHEASEAGQVEQTSSEEEPHRLIHEVKKPIIQEVREIITPYRKVIQEIQPVVEEIHTIVAKGEGRRNFDHNQSKSSGGGASRGVGGGSRGGHSSGSSSSGQTGVNYAGGSGSSSVFTQKQKAGDDGAFEQQRQYN